MRVGHTKLAFVKMNFSSPPPPVLYDQSLMVFMVFPSHGIMVHIPWPLRKSNPWNSNCAAQSYMQVLIFFAQMVIGIMKNSRERWKKAPKRRRNSWSRLEADVGNMGLVIQSMKLIVCIKSGFQLSVESNFTFALVLLYFVL